MSNNNSILWGELKMSTMDVITIAGVVITLICGLISVLVTTKKVKGKNIEIKGNKNTVHSNDVNFQINSNNRNSFTLNGNSIVNSTITAPVIMRKTNNSTVVNNIHKHEHKHTYSKGTRNSSSDSDGFGELTVLALVTGVIVLFFVMFKAEINKTLLWTSIIGFITTFIFAMRIFNVEYNKENRLFSTYELFSLPCLFVGLLVGAVLFILSFNTPARLDEYILKIKQGGIFGFLTVTDYKSETIYVMLQLASTVFFCLLALLFFGSFLYMLSLWKTEIMNEEKFMYKVWSKIYNFNVFHYNTKVSIVYICVLVVLVLVPASGIISLFFK
jgi:hypothetical protein